jgi:hypothetical protein
MLHIAIEESKKQAVIAIIKSKKLKSPTGFESKVPQVSKVPQDFKSCGTLLTEIIFPCPLIK